MEHRRQELNNYIQRKYGNTKQVHYYTSQEGPNHNPVWLAVAKIDHIELGRGIGASCGEAKERAAEMVLANLRC